MTDPTIYWELFYTFFLIGMFTIGGGYAMLSLIETQTVAVHGWLTEGAFTDIVGISQMTPGPIGINSATYIGYTVLQNQGAGEFLSILGSVCSTFAVVLPSFIIMMVIVRAYTSLSGNPVFKNVMKGLRPAVVGLIGAAALILIFKVTFTPSHVQVSLMRENFHDWKSWLIFAGAFATTMWSRTSPIYVIIAAGIIGVLIY